MMKRQVILAALALLLALGGCAGQNPPATEPVETTEPAPTGLYAPGDLETQSQGAIRSYRTGEDCYGIAGIGDRVLLFSGGEQTRLSLYSGDQCLPAGEALLPVDLREAMWQLTDTGFAYYDGNNRRVVYLDSQLQQIHSVDMPEDMEGAPLISPTCEEIYYCAGQEIRGLDTERGISRLIKSHGCRSQQLIGCYFDGSMICCRAEKEGGRVETIYLSTQDGATCGVDGGIAWLSSYEEQYLGYRLDGVTPQYITGLRSGGISQLNTEEAVLLDATALGSAVGYRLEEGNGLQLSYYDLTSGQRTASVTLEEAITPIDSWANRFDGCVYLLCSREEKPLLLRWDVKASAVTEEASYLAAVYTESAPDESGLEALQSRVDEINKQHGTEIRIWQKAVQTPGSYALKPEYQTAAIANLLDQLEPVLQMFPESFLRKSVNNKIRICIVRSVNGEQSAARYWDEGDAYVLLPVGVDPQQALLQALGYIVDSHILGNSPMLDAWEGLNPEGFLYGQQASAQHLEGESRAFADAASTVSVTDDRSILFYYAITAGNEEMFRTEAMQAKLLLLCQSIRDAWRLERKEETYLWEQYLAESIAYKK